MSHAVGECRKHSSDGTATYVQIVCGKCEKHDTFWRQIPGKFLGNTRVLLMREPWKRVQHMCGQYQKTTFSDNKLFGISAIDTYGVFPHTHVFTHTQRHVTCRGWVQEDICQIAQQHMCKSCAANVKIMTRSGDKSLGSLTETHALFEGESFVNVCNTCAANV